MNRPSTTIVALTLNELAGVQVILPQIDPRYHDRLVVVDGGSTDGTVEWCRENGYEVYVQKCPGIRHAYFEILPTIFTDVVITLSPDGNCPPDAVPMLIEKMSEGYDLVIASRYAEGKRSDDDDFITAFGNWLFTRTVNVLHGGQYTDAMVIFRAFRRDLVANLCLDEEDAYRLPERLFRTTISWEPLMSVRAAKCRMRVVDVAVGEPPRIGGTRKLQIVRWGAAYYFQFWRELWYWKPAARSVNRT